MSSPDPTEQTEDPAPGTGATAVIILAAGGGTRMKSRIPKVLHRMAGRTLLDHVLTAAEQAQPRHLVVVIGHQRELLAEHLAESAPHVHPVVQEEQLGTAHAVQVALAALRDVDGEVSGEIVVTTADTPMLTGETLQQLVRFHRRSENAVTLLSATVPDPTGYGRVVRGEDDRITGIVEHKDADEQTRAIDEINSAIYVFDADVLTEALGRIGNDNAQGEYYLTDVVGIAIGDGRRAGAWRIDDLWQTEGVNDRVQLARMAAEMNRRICERWMRAGVTIIDPATTWITDDVTLAPDVTLLPGTSLEGATSVAEGATIGPYTTLIDSEVGPDATIVRAHAQLAVIGPRASVGPFAYLRPGTSLADDVRLGTFVEAKNAQLGARSKMQHLAYAGDATIGEDVNIGAGVIFANYDGVDKHHSDVGDASFVGSDSTLVAPIKIGAGVYVAAGSTITEDVAPGELGIARGRQRNVDGWVQRRRSGTKTAQAAQQASSTHTDDARAEEP